MIILQHLMAFSKGVIPILVIGCGLIPAAAWGDRPTCAEVQQRLKLVAASGHESDSDSNWKELEPLLGRPSRVGQDGPGKATLYYDFSGCSVQIQVGSKDKVLAKTFRTTPANAAPEAAAPSESNLASTVAALETTVRQLEARLAAVEKQLQAMSASRTPARH